MNRSGAIAVATVLMVACGHMEATPQLKQAQAAYEKAAQGPAAQYSPAQLADAKKSLDQATAERDATLKDLELAQERQARAAAESQLAQSRKELEQHARVQDTARGTVITLSGGVLFKSGKADLLPEAQEHLSQVATFLKS